MHDILIRGGTLYDGSGAPACRATSRSRTAASPRSARGIREPAAKTIDASGLAVAPGFIDIKTHSDFTLPINPKAESKVRQGVTTEIIGHCGFSVAPCLPGKVELLRDYLVPSAPWTPFRELTFPEYLDTFPGTSVNAGMLVGHNTLRLMVMGMATASRHASELAQMIDLLEHGLNAGALGLSSGLFTPPGSYAKPAEMRRLRPRAEATQRRLLHPSARRIRRGARRRAGGDRHRRALRRACRDRALQVLRHQQLGQGRDRAAR